MCWRRPKDARTRIRLGWRAGFDCPDSGGCCAVRVAHGTTRSGARHRANMGWLWMGLAPGAGPLEPVERGMGSAALCAGPPRRWPGSLRESGGSLRRLAILRQGLLINNPMEVPAIAAGLPPQPEGLIAAHLAQRHATKARPEARGIGFLGHRPRPCKPASASCRDRKRLLQGDDAPMKSVYPVGTGVPDDR